MPRAYWHGWKKIIDFAIINFGNCFSEFYGTELYFKAKKEYENILKIYNEPITPEKGALFTNTINFLYLNFIQAAKQAIQYLTDEMGITIVKVLAIAGLFVGIQRGVGQSQAAYEEIRVHKQLEVFSMIDNFMHKKFNETISIPDPIRETHDKIFLETDLKYHTAKNLNEKYKAAEDVIVLALIGEKLLQELGYAKPEDILYFDELVYQFYQIK